MNRSKVAVINLDPPQKTRAEIDAIAEPKFGEQYFDTTNQIYVMWCGECWEQMHNHPGGA